MKRSVIPASTVADATVLYVCPALLLPQRCRVQTTQAQSPEPVHGTATTDAAAVVAGAGAATTTVVTGAATTAIGAIAAVAAAAACYRDRGRAGRRHKVRLARVGSRQGVGACRGKS